jgi:hypothetical protein
LPIRSGARRGSPDNCSDLDSNGPFDQVLEEDNVKRLALVIGLVCAVGASSSGCATVMAGGPDHVQVATNPPGAQVFVDEQFVGTTPGIVTLDRAHSQGRIRIQAPGYQPVMLIRSKGINGWFWANLCVGWVGFLVDVITGDYQSFDDTPVMINLMPMGGPAAPPGYGPPAGGYGPAPCGGSPCGPQPMAPQPMGPGGQ